MGFASALHDVLRQAVGHPGTGLVHRGPHRLDVADVLVVDEAGQVSLANALLLIAEDGANLVLRNLPLAIIARGKFWVNNHAHILKPKRGNIEFLCSVMENLSYLPWISGPHSPNSRRIDS